METPAITEGKSDRRRSPRKSHIIEAWISSPTAKAEGERLEVTAIDLSKHGVAFDTLFPLPVHAFFVIEIGFGDQRLCCEIRTVSCRPMGQRLFHIGAEFA
jgi:hypothetical protein